jgi:hypothetical protein
MCQHQKSQQVRQYRNHRSVPVLRSRRVCPTLTDHTHPWPSGSWCNRQARPANASQAVTPVSAPMKPCRAIISANYPMRLTWLWRCRTQFYSVETLHAVLFCGDVARSSMLWRRARSFMLWRRYTQFYAVEKLHAVLCCGDVACSFMLWRRCMQFYVVPVCRGGGRRVTGRNLERGHAT